MFYHLFKFEVSKIELGIISMRFSSNSTKTKALPQQCQRFTDCNFMSSESLLYPSPTNLCQMSSLPSLSFSNLSLPFHSCFRPSSGTNCFKSGHIVILTVLSLRSPIYIIQHPKEVFQNCYHSITSYFKTSKGSLFPL